MKLYHGITSVCSVKVRIGLAEIGLDYDEQVLDLQKGDQFAPDYLTINPNGVVPTLVDDNLVMGESSLILEYLDREHNDGRLMPKGRAAEVAARQWLLRTLSIHDAINSLTFSTAQRDRILANKSPEEITASLTKMPDLVKRMKRKDLLENGLDSVHVKQALTTLSRCFADMGAALKRSKWISGSDFGIADIAVVSYIDRLERLGFGGMLAEPYPDVSEWLQAMQDRASYQTEVVSRIDPMAAKTMLSSGADFWQSIRIKWQESRTQIA